MKIKNNFIVQGLIIGAGVFLITNSVIASTNRCGENSAGLCLEKCGEGYHEIPLSNPSLCDDYEKCCVHSATFCEDSGGTCTDSCTEGYELSLGEYNNCDEMCCKEPEGNSTPVSNSNSASNACTSSGWKCQEYCENDDDQMDLECDGDNICCKSLTAKASNAVNNTAKSNNTKQAANPTSSGSTDNIQPVEFPNPIKATSMSEFFGSILGSLMSVIAYVAIIFIIIGAVMYMLSAGNQNMIENAKKTITGAVIGLAIALAAPTFLKQIKDILGGAQGTNPDDIVNQAYTFKDIAVNVLNFLLSITGILAIIALIVGAVFYLTSYGDEDRMKKGKEIATAALIGIIVAFSALVIVRQIANLIVAQ
jgi:hypothetical protein